MSCIGNQEVAKVHNENWCQLRDSFAILNSIRTKVILNTKRVMILIRGQSGVCLEPFAFVHDSKDILHLKELVLASYISSTSGDGVKFFSG